MVKKLAFIAPLALLAMTPLSANATLVLSPTTASCGTASCLLAIGAQTGQAQIDAAIAGYLGTSTEQYKQNVGGPETGAFAGSYTTTFSNSATDPKDATIEYVGGPILSGATHLLVKDGMNEPAWYLFSIVWNGIETISLENFWPGSGAISHVTIYGTGGSGPPPTQVPEPGTLGLLGAGLIAFGFWRRRKAA